MTDAGPQTKPQQLLTGTKAVSHLRGNVHFIIAVVTLAATGVVIHLMGWTEKLPVPWPQGVVVSEDYRWTSLPKKIGPFVLAGNDQRTGEVIFRKEDMRTLGIGTSYDEDRHANRRSNWYVARNYRDTRIEDDSSPYRYWRMEVYYYTGMKDQVPHVPERCLQAGGVKLLGTNDVTFNVSTVQKPWEGAIAFNRVSYERTAAMSLVSIKGFEYYVFSLNGEPETSWEMVRWKLSDPRERYCYFAKIQFSPASRYAPGSEADADKHAQDFLNYFLPVVMRSMPMPEDIDKLASKQTGSEE